MIRLTPVAHILGLFLLGLAAAMLIPLAIAVPSGEDTHPLLLSIVITAAAGSLIVLRYRRPTQDISQREGILMVVLIWISTGLFGGLPFYFTPYFPTFSDAVFEAVSGFTTTGATVLSNVEVLPGGIQFWRCFTHWLGGMGIVLLGIAILPLLSIGGMPLYRAEFSGARSEKLKPRMAEAALSLWKIYFALTLAEYITLRLLGMDSFEAACHSFSTLGTGGFSTRTASIAAFQSPAIEYAIIVFMVLAGINFTYHYRLWVERQPGTFFRDPEVRAYFALSLAATGGIFLSIWGQYSTPEAFRHALFQTTSIITTTGFITADFEKWLPFPQLVLLALMFSGGCTGSTAGGLKVSRMVMLLKVVRREFHRMVERRAVFAIRLGARVVPEATIQSLLNLVYLAFLVNFAASLTLTALGLDILTSISAVAACMFNVGPGLGAVGPAEHFGHLPALAKWVLSAVMIAGRLEFYSALVVLAPAFWRK